MKPFYLLVLALVISAVSCRTKEGAPGPAGATTLNKQGSISGTITYLDQNANSAEAAFNYEYFESLDDNKFYYYEKGPSSYYEVSFSRRDIKDVNNYFNIACYGDGLAGVEDDPSSTNVYFSFLTLVNNELLEFTASGGTITNLKLDPTTGRLTFDYTNNSVQLNNRIASIAVKVDVILNRSSTSISPR